MTIYFTIFLQAVCQIISFARLATFLGLVTDIFKKKIVGNLLFMLHELPATRVSQGNVI
jgi:hypothetical protein